MLKSKLKYKPFYFLAFSILFLIGVKLISYYNSTDFWTYSKVLIGFLFLFFALFIFIIYLSIPRVKIYEKEVEISSYLSKSKFFNLDEIESWFIDTIKSKSGEYEKLYIIFNTNSKICLKSFSYSNYNEIKRRLTLNKSKNNRLNKFVKIRKLKTVSILVCIVGFVFVFVGFTFLNYKVYNQNNVHVLKGVLSDDIQLKKGRKSHYSIVIKLVNYKKNDFSINNLAIKETFYKELIENCVKGDTISLMLDKEEFNRKIAIKEDFSFYDKLYYFKNIDVLSVEDDQYKYLTLQNYNRVHLNNDYWGVGFFGLIGFFFMFIGVKGIIKSKRELKELAVDLK